MGGGRKGIHALASLEEPLVAGEPDIRPVHLGFLVMAGQGDSRAHRSQEREREKKQRPFGIAVCFVQEDLSQWFLKFQQKHHRLAQIVVSGRV